MINAKSVADEANTVIKKMIDDWQKEPLMFFSEHDVQAEIFSRLKDWLQDKKLESVKVNKVENIKYKNKCRIENEAEQIWHRLHCEVHLKCKERLRGIRPDIIIWDDLERYEEIDEDEFLNIVYKFSNNWPMIWACEIKYNHGGAKQVKTFTKEQIEEEFKKDGGQDKDKKNLHLLLEQGKEKGGDKYFGTKYATILNIYRRRLKPENPYFHEIEDSENINLKIINAFLAFKENNESQGC